jgi:pyridoxal phosphate enzyme (YggS family)
MAAKTAVLRQIVQCAEQYGAELVAVSKTKPPEDISVLYAAGQRIFGENYVQELVEKQAALPGDIRWHFIGHLQTNKVKYIAPFVSMIHSVDNLKLLREIDKQAARADRIIDCLLQVHVAREQTKFGLDEAELNALLEAVAASPGEFGHVRLCGIMGMASNTDDQLVVRPEFRRLKTLFEQVRARYFSKARFFRQLSMGMSGDYLVALEEGSTLIRIGSLLFGPRDYAGGGPGPEKSDG